MSWAAEGRRATSNLAGRLGLGLLGLLVALPIAFSLLYALLYSLGLAGLLRGGFTLAHWTRVLTSGEIWASFGLSLYVALVAVALTTALALALALALGEAVTRGPLAFALYLPLTLPGTVAAFLAFQVLSGGGLLARGLRTAGLLAPQDTLVPLVQDPLAVGIIAAHVGLAVPFFTLLFRELAASERLAELTTLATALGASRWQCLSRVAVPILLRRAASNLVLYFIVVLGSFEIPLLLGQSAPQMLSVLTLRKFALYDLSQKPQGYTVALLYSAFVLLLLAGIARRRRADAS